MKLIICGNGFDLHHLLETSYSHYRVFLEKNYKYALKGFEEFPYIKIDKSELWSDLEASLELDYEYIMEDILSEFSLDLTDDSDSRWYNFSTDMELATKFIYDFTGQFFYEWIQNINYTNIKKSKLLDFVINDNIYLTFNYTPTLEKIYDINSTNIMHLHGFVDHINSSVMLGEDIIPNFDTIEQAEIMKPIASRNITNSEIIRENLQFGSIHNDSVKVEKELDYQYKTEEFYETSIKPGIYEISNFCEASSKDITTNFSKLKDFTTAKDIDEVIILGHSVLGVDKQYYEDIIIPLFKDVTWTFYAYNDDTKKYCEKFIEEFTLKNHKIKEW